MKAATKTIEAPKARPGRTSFFETRLTIDLDALAHNLKVLRRAAAGADVAAVVKADAYGLGAAPIGRRLEHEGVQRFFVARLAEGEALRAALRGPAVIYVLDGLAPGQAARMTAAGLTPVLCSEAQLADARDFPGALALSVDTGMNRQGLDLAETRRVAADPALVNRIELVMSHLGSAASPSHPRNAQQLAGFREVPPLFPAARASLAASAGIFLGEAYRFDMVRPGVSLFGGGPFEQPDPRLRAVATLEAPLVDIRQTSAGALVGYGESVELRRPTRLGIVGAGYADGVIRSAKAGGRAFAGGAARPLLMVNMDMLAIDLGEADVAVGDPVELLGANVLLDEQAAAAGTVAHEWLVRLSPRAERRLLGAV